MNTVKLFALLLSLLFSNILNAQDNRLHDYVQASIEFTRAPYLEKDTSKKQVPSLFPETKSVKKANPKPIISVNGKSVDMQFLKLLDISDTLSVVNVAHQIKYGAYQVRTRVAIMGWVAVESKKKQFKKLWKAEKANYPKRKRKKTGYM